MFRGCEQDPLVEKILSSKRVKKAVRDYLQEKIAEQKAQKKAEKKKNNFSSTAEVHSVLLVIGRLKGDL